MEISEYQKIAEMVSHYSKRIHSWINKRSECKEEIGETSCFSFTTKTVILKENSKPFAKGHEYGHVFWHSVTHPYVEGDEFLDYRLLFEDLSQEEIRKELEEMGDKRTLIPFTDFLSAYICIPDDFYKHSPEYWERFHFYDFMEGNEAFASMFGYLYERNIFAFTTMQKYFPKFVDSCLDLIEAGLVGS